MTMYINFNISHYKGKKIRETTSSKYNFTYKHRQTILWFNMWTLLKFGKMFEIVRRKKEHCEE